jgi:lipoprotein NlpI
MNRSGQLRWAMAVSAILAMTAVSRAADCSLDSVQISPPTVIEPCTTLLQNPSLSPAERSAALFVRGKGYHRTKELDRARQDYDAALKITPNNDEIYAERANISFQFGSPR